MFKKWTKNWEKVVNFFKKITKSPPKAAKKFLALFLHTPFQNPPNISVFDSLTIRFLTRGGGKRSKTILWHYTQIREVSVEFDIVSFHVQPNVKTRKCVRFNPPPPLVRFTTPKKRSFRGGKTKRRG